MRCSAPSKARNWATNKLATLAGVSPSYIRDLEKGLKCPTIEVLDNICFAFDVSLSDFLNEKSEEISTDRLSSLYSQQKKLLNHFLDSLN
ncbi:MAG: helix-turn-helix transcriptional regulator [Clostridia bacterium]|nr:helix-turn-helix transcriptional regulator [Clostridia bacterium]